MGEHFMTSREPLATVGDQVIAIADVQRSLRQIAAAAGEEAVPLPGSPAAVRNERLVLHGLVTEAVLRQEAQRRGLGAAGVASSDAQPEPEHHDPQYPDPDPAEIAAAVFDAVTAEVDVDESAVVAYHRANADRYRRPDGRRIRHVLSSTAPAAADVAAGCRRDVAGGRASVAGSAAGASTIEMTPERFAGPLGDQVFAARPGDVVGPIASELGWHVAVVLEIIPGGVAPLADVRDTIAADLLAAERGRVFDEWLTARRATVTVAPGYEHPGDPRAAHRSHRH